VEVILETPRLLLRPFRSSDLDAFARMEKLGERLCGEVERLGATARVYEARRDRRP
jgi:hypothetical protein